MIRRPTSRRPGTSLVEVLVGFGILGIGVTSVITLFPFSALTLGQALRDDRTTTCAIMADGMVRDIHRIRVVEPGDSNPQEDYPRKMDNPQTAIVLTNGTLTQLPPLQKKDTGPSYPVFLDPMGYVAGRGPVGDFGETGIPRCTLAFIGGNQSLALRYCSLMDSLSYDDNGTVNQNFNMRELRYNFAWVLQRPVNSDRFTVRMQVVVFNKRTHLYTPLGSEAVYGPNANSAGVLFTPGETRIDNVPGTADIRKGTWVMDAGLPEQGLRHAEFYRVVSVTPLNNGTMTLEVHKPVSRPDGLINPANTSQWAYTGRLVVMPGVADVFERPNLTAAAAP